MKSAWTTTETLEQAKILAKLCVEAKLAACVQISAPITSIYNWEGQVEESTEFRITLKFFDNHLTDLCKLVLQNHPYDTPQWVVAELSDVSDAYLAWAQD